MDDTYSRLKCVLKFINLIFIIIIIITTMSDWKYCYIRIYVSIGWRINWVWDLS